MVESFWGRMQVELFNRKRWKTRIELATAIHDYIELFHNTTRRHSSLNMLTPTEFEDQYQQIINGQASPPDSRTATPKKRG
jgi:transposase InsO family protein